MAIEKVNEDINLDIEPNSEAQIMVPGMENNAMMMEDGSAIVNPMPDASGKGAFNANLAEIIPDDELQSLSKGLVGDYEADKDARSSWLKTYSDGLDLLGWTGECGGVGGELLELAPRARGQGPLHLRDH